MREPTGGAVDPSLHVETVEEAERLWHHVFDLRQQRLFKEEIEADAAAWSEEKSGEDWQRLQAKQEMRQASETKLLALYD